jgi:hypothetical protein
VSARASLPGESLTKGTILHSLAAAVRDLWGDDGARALAAELPEETAAATTGAELVPIRWYPTRYLLDWNAAMMEGPARRDEEAFRRCVDRSMDLGFGRVRRAFLALATPTLLGKRAAQLWRHEHTHGSLAIVTEGLAPNTARVTLADHPFVTTAYSRVAIAEVMRHLLSLSRAHDVRETHAAHGDALVITLRWH